MTRFFFLFIAMFLIISTVESQRTVGLLSYKPWISQDGYNLIYPHNQSDVYLLDNCGEVVHLWEGEEGRVPGNTAYILENGNMVKTHRSSDISGDAIWAGGGGEAVEIVDWENNSLWYYAINTNEERLHHDIAVLPNGNILMVVWEKITGEDAIAMGREEDLLADGELWPDKVIEVDPSTDEIVWEWRAWDHLVQDVDASKPNFGVIADNPQRINVNYDFGTAVADWMHVNAIDYDPVNDHVIISVPTFHEMWVVDHSTTTEQAASNFGGTSGKGGDLLYRWGNPAAYDNGDAEDQKLFYQHDVQFIDDFLLPSHPFYGKYAAFNNRVGADFSSVVTWNNPYDMYTATFETSADGTFMPEDFNTSTTHPIPQNLYSTGLSSVQILQNDNMLITDGRHGYSFELTPENEIVWEYVTPFKGGLPVNQEDELLINENLTFRLKRYPVDFAGFEGRTLEGNGFIEIGGDLDFCNNILPIEMTYDNDRLSISPNPVSDYVSISWETSLYEEITIVDIFGNTLMKTEVSGGKVRLDVSDLPAGYYFVRTSGGGVKKFIKIN